MDSAPLQARSVPTLLIEMHNMSLSHGEKGNMKALETDKIPLSSIFIRQNDLQNLELFLAGKTLFAGGISTGNSLLKRNF